MKKNGSVRKLENSLYEEGDPVPADQDHDDSDGKEQVDQEFSGRNFSPGRYKLYHFIRIAGNRPDLPVLTAKPDNRPKML